MFTPQRKAPGTPVQPAPAPRNGRLSSAAKGKAVAFVDGPVAPPPAPAPPPLSFLAENDAGSGYDCGNMEDWRRFKEAGLLDPATLERRDREALAERVSRLEKELHDYQFNMGLLLIEKKELTSNCEELRHEFEEAREILKREQSAHLIAFSEAEKREENLKRALELEKNCVFDLEKALLEMRDEYERAKGMSETKTTDVDACMAQLEDQHLEVERKLHSANVQVAEADRKITEIDMNLQELESREATLVAQRQTLVIERDVHESKLKKQKEEFNTWERKLQEREERLLEQKRVVDGREEKLHESESRYKQKESDLYQLLKTIDLDKCTLKQKEIDVRKRLEELASQEKEVEALRDNLEKREKQLHALEERLSDKERIEIQKLVDEHHAILETKLEELELEMLQKRNSLDEELKSKLQAVEKREVEINHQEAKLAKREQALEEKSERVKEKEKKIQERSKALKQEESCLKNCETKLEAEREQLSADRENLQILNDEIEKLGEEVRKKELLIHEENEKLKVNEELRSEHDRLQSSLNQEMEKWRHQNEFLMKETEDLSQERSKVEKDWEALEEKRAIVEKELKKLEEEKETFARFRYLEEEKLKKEKIEMEDRIKQELESIKLERESFAAKMKHEQLTLAENARNEHKQMVEYFEQQKRELENSAQRQQDGMEEKFEEKKRAFEEESSREMRRINELKEFAEKQKEEMEFERLRVTKMSEAIAFDKEELEVGQREIREDINTLNLVSKNLKEQREAFLNERARLLSFIEKLEVCQTCGDSTSEFIVSHLQLSTADDEALPLPQLADHIAKKSEQAILACDKVHTKGSPGADFGLSDSGGPKSWLRKCASKIFKISPNKRMEHNADNCQEELPTSSSQRHLQEKLGLQGSADGRPDPSDSIADTFDRQNMQLNKLTNEAATEDSPFVNEPRNIDSKEDEVPEESEQSSLQGGRSRAGRKRTTGVRRRKQRTKANDPDYSLPVDADEYKDPDYSLPADAEEEKTTVTSIYKRSRAKSAKRKETEHDDDSSDGLADSMPAGGGRKKRREAVAALPTPGEKRYNLRRHKTAGASSAAETSNAKGNADKVATNHGKRSKKAAPSHEKDPAHDVDINSEDRRSDHHGPASTTKSIEISSERAVMFKMPAGNADDNVEAAKSAENMRGEEPNSVDNAVASKEVHETAEKGEEEEDGSIYFEDNADDDNDDDDDGGDDEESDDPGEVSIGRKLWKFFTT